MPFIGCMKAPKQLKEFVWAKKRKIVGDNRKKGLFNGSISLKRDKVDLSINKAAGVAIM